MIISIEKTLIVNYALMEYFDLPFMFKKINEHDMIF